MKRPAGTLWAWRDRAIRSRLRLRTWGKGLRHRGGKGLGHTRLGRYLGPRLLGKLGPQGKMGSPRLLPRGSAPQLYVHSGHQRALSDPHAGALGSPEVAPLPECSSLVLPRASRCPSLPHPLTPCLSPTLLTPPTEAQESVQMPPPPPSCYLGKPLGCPEAQCFHLYNGIPPCQHHGEQFLGSDGAGPVGTLHSPEHRGVPGTVCPARGIWPLARWGKVGQGPRGTPGQTLLGCVWVRSDGDPGEEGQVSRV